MHGFDYSRANKRWQHLRKLALRRDKHRCQEAARYGISADAEVVHHIWPAEDYPEYAYCLWNLVSLSAAAHDRMHDRVTRKLTALGERWRRKTIPPPPHREEMGSSQLGGELRAHAAENFSAKILSAPREQE